MKVAMWVIVVLGMAAIVDRVLLVLEGRGWINYRRTGLSWGAAAYHTLEFHGVVEPGMLEVQEARYSEREEEDESGAPPGQGSPSELPPSTGHLSSIAAIG